VQDIPFWVVDFSASSGLVPSFWDTQVLQYRAAGNWKFKVSIDDDNMLFIDGKQINSIQHKDDNMNVQDDIERVATGTS
jgi:hypothetical protein